MPTPAQIARRKFFRHGPAVFGLIYTLCCFLIALLGYLLVPDASTHANTQLLEWAKAPPGSQASILWVPQPDAAAQSSVPVFTGYENPGVPIALHDIGAWEIHHDWVRFQTFSGARDSLPLSRFQTDRSKDLALNFADRYIESRTFWLGTDTYGRDLLSRILLGTRVSLSIGLLAMVLSISIGVLMGTLAGFLGGWVDRVIMWGISVLWSIPTLLLALAISFVLGRGFWQLFVAIGISMWVEAARIVRGQILSLRELPYVEAARALGYRPWRIMWRHVLPQVWSPIIVIAVANFGAAVLIESGLSFLGIGVEVPIPSWGGMIYEGYTYIVFENGKWLAFFPGLALVLLIMSINLIGIGLRDAWDVKQ